MSPAALDLLGGLCILLAAVGYDAIIRFWADR